MSDILDVIDTRSSIRKYEDKMIPADVCRKLVEAGLKAPTATNKQEIHITVVTKDNPVQKEIQNDMNPDAEVNFYYDAPVTLYLSALESFKWSAVDAGIAVENIHLAAAGMGLGSVILGCMETTLNGEKKEEYARKHPEDVFKLRVQKSARYYNNPGRLMPGAAFLYRGKRYIMTGQLTGGKYYRALGQGKKNFPAKDCRILEHNTGIIYI